MKWSRIRTRHPGQFILLKNYQTEPVDANHFRVTEGEVIATDADFHTIRKKYKHLRAKGVDVIFCLPQTEDFIVETAPMMGFLNAICRTCGAEIQSCAINESIRLNIMPFGLNWTPAEI